MKKSRTREDILEEIEELEEELEEYEDDDELRKTWNNFGKQFKIAQEEAGLSREETLNLIMEMIKNGRY